MLKMIHVNVPLIYENTLGCYKQSSTTKKIKKSLSPWLMVHHTAGASCNKPDECKKLIKAIETLEMTQLDAKEILSHFFIGGDGSIYEGRGWYYADEYIPGHGLFMSISFIGDYRNKDAPEIMLTAFHKFVAGYCQHVFSAHNDHRCTDCPGKHLKAQLEKSKYYDHSKNTRPCERHREYVQKFYTEFKKNPYKDNYYKYIYDPTIRTLYEEDKYLKTLI
uniref:Peptidoglycan recognition protein family domain-containing protein n=1 Tax=Strigamia maritima TaxID=126957 RepID=T1J1Z2_STRMM